MCIYKTAELAKMVGIHPNTVRLYEKLGFISKPERMTNGYRIFTKLHLNQLQFIKITFQVEILQNSLRKQAIAIIKTTAKKEFISAIEMTNIYIGQIQQEKSYAEEAIFITKSILASSFLIEDTHLFTRKQVSNKLEISMDTLRNWEMNGLLTIKRKKNGYRVYSNQDLQRLRIIHTLRRASYSLSSILRLLTLLDQNHQLDIKKVINTPDKKESIISVCDQLLTSLSAAEDHAYTMIEHLNEMNFVFNRTISY